MWRKTCPGSAWRQRPALCPVLYTLGGGGGEAWPACRAAGAGPRHHRHRPPMAAPGHGPSRCERARMGRLPPLKRGWLNGAGRWTQRCTLSSPLHCAPLQPSAACAISLHRSLCVLQTTLQHSQVIQKRRRNGGSSSGSQGSRHQQAEDEALEEQVGASMNRRAGSTGRDVGDGALNKQCLQSVWSGGEGSSNCMGREGGWGHRVLRPSQHQAAPPDRRQAASCLAATGAGQRAATKKDRRSQRAHSVGQPPLPRNPVEEAQAVTRLCRLLADPWLRSACRRLSPAQLAAGKNCVRTGTADRW